jgi:hypothetical protein
MAELDPPRRTYSFEADRREPKVVTVVRGNLATTRGDSYRWRLPGTVLAWLTDRERRAAEPPPHDVTTPWRVTRRQRSEWIDLVAR